jgi:site-specific recombinase XerD
MKHIGPQRAYNDQVDSLTTPDQGRELGRLVEVSRGYMTLARAPNTLRAYASDWRQFEEWCCRLGFAALPAPVEAVVLFLAEQAEGKTVSTVVRRLSAISVAHRCAGHPSPSEWAEVRALMAGLRRARGTAPERRRPLMTEQLEAALKHLPADALGTRDRALLLVGFAGALRRSEVVGLDWEDCEFVEQGLVILLRRSKTDQEGEGRRLGIPSRTNRARCPVKALMDWQTLGGWGAGPVFRPVNRYGDVEERRLSDRAVARIVQRSLLRAGIDATGYAGHSLRAGFATSAARGGASERAIMNQTGHKSVTTLRQYIREGSLFTENAVEYAGL